MATSRRQRQRGVRASVQTGLSTPPQRSDWRLGLIVLIGAVVYANSIGGPFVFDDRATVLENSSIRDWTNVQVFAAHRELPTAGRPLVNLTHALNYALDGTAPRGYHVLNVILHLLCGLLLYACVNRALKMRRVPEALHRWSPDIALAAALVWLVHPLNSEVVDYVTQRSESLMALCYFGTVYASARALSDPHPRRWSTIGVSACALGMLCKESMVTAPAAVWLFDAVFVFGTAALALRARWPYYGALAGTWAVLAVAIWNGPRMHSAGFGTRITPWAYLLDQTVMITRYLRLAVWPTDLVVAYGPAGSLPIATVWPYALFVLIVATAIVIALWRVPLVGFAGAWLLLTLAPTSSVVPIATEVGAERRIYLGLAALIPLVVTAMAWIATRVAPRQPRAAFALVSAAIVVILAAATIQRNREYHSPLGLAQTVLARWPTPFAHAAVGVQLAVEGRHAAAIEQLQVAAPHYPLARYHLGGELFNQGATEAALVQLRQFIDLEPALAEAVPARLMIGRGEMLRGDFRRADEALQQVLTMTAVGAEPHIAAAGFLADSLLHQQRFSDAAPYYRAFLTARPRDIAAWINLGVALAQTGTQDAAAAFRHALALDPSNETARRNLAILNEPVKGKP